MVQLLSPLVNPRGPVIGPWGRGSSGVPRRGRGRLGACPYFLPEGPQRSPGSRPARRAVASAMRSSL